MDLISCNLFQQIQQSCPSPTYLRYNLFHYVGVFLDVSQLIKRQWSSLINLEVSHSGQLLQGAIHKRRRKFLLLFDTFLLHVGILTLIYQTSTLNILATSEFRTPSPPKIFRHLLWMTPSCDRARCSLLAEFGQRLSSSFLETASQVSVTNQLRTRHLIISRFLPYS